MRLPDATWTLHRRRLSVQPVAAPTFFVSGLPADLCSGCFWVARCIDVSIDDQAAGTALVRLRVTAWFYCTAEVRIELPTEEHFSSVVQSRHSGFTYRIDTSATLYSCSNSRCSAS